MPNSEDVIKLIKKLTELERVYYNELKKRFYQKLMKIYVKSPLEILWY